MTGPCQLGAAAVGGTDWVCVAAFPVLIGGFFALAIILSHLHLKQKAQVFEALESMGFEVLPCPSEIQKLDAYELLGRSLKDGLRGVSWIARGKVSGRSTFVIQHVEVRRLGRKCTHRTYRTFAVTSCPAGWPRLELTEFQLGGELLWVVGVHRTQFRHASSEFERRWRVSCDDPDFANLVLNERVTDLALSLPGNSGVLIGGGHIVVSLKEYVRADEAVCLAALAAEFLSLIPAELSAYQSPIRA